MDVPTGLHKAQMGLHIGRSIVAQAGPGTHPPVATPDWHPAASPKYANVPVAQALHGSSEPVAVVPAVVDLPVGQFLHVVSPSREIPTAGAYLPIAQPTHVYVFVALDHVWTFPGAQLLHDSASLAAWAVRMGADLPGAHALQVVAPAGAYFPTEHDLHQLPSKKVPAGQSIH